ncbi:hypothetical protein BH09BAC4_BH09BAC4_34880 [soil metagenome]
MYLQRNENIISSPDNDEIFNPREKDFLTARKNEMRLSLFFPAPLVGNLQRGT